MGSQHEKFFQQAAGVPEPTREEMRAVSGRSAAAGGAMMTAAGSSARVFGASDEPTPIYKNAWRVAFALNLFVILLGLALNSPWLHAIFGLSLLIGIYGLAGRDEDTRERGRGIIRGSIVALPFVVIVSIVIGIILAGYLRAHRG